EKQQERDKVPGLQIRGTNYRLLVLKILPCEMDPFFAGIRQSFSLPPLSLPWRCRNSRRKSPVLSNPSRASRLIVDPYGESNDWKQFPNTSPREAEIVP